MPDAIQRKVLDKTYEANDLAKLKDLVARFEAAIQNHDAKLAAAQTALMEHEGLNQDHAIHETLHFKSSSEHESSNSTSYGPFQGIQGNTGGSCTITIGHTHQENFRTTALAAARLAACPADNVRPGRLPPGRLPSEEVGRMRSEFRLFAFETGRQYYAEGTLENIKLATVITAFEKKLLGQVPASLRSSITVDAWKEAVRANNIDMIAMARSVPEVKTVHTIEEKIRLRPDMKYLIDWCIGWLKTDRAAGRIPAESEHFPWPLQTAAP